MINIFVSMISLLVLPIVVLAILLGFFSFYWNQLSKFFNLSIYNNYQKIHLNNVSRLGGICMYLFFWIIYFFDYYDNLLFSDILFSSIPLFVISIIEDVKHNTTPKIRLISMVLSCLVFFYLNSINLPIISFPIFGDLIMFFPINYIFFIFAILVVINGMNLIDGLNGLFCLTALFQLLSLGFLAYIFSDDQLINLIIIFIIPLIIFIFFNFFLGRVFAGDLGAYMYGFIISILTIYIFGKHNDLFTWLAILILFYPCFELLFSFVRKVKDGFSPFEADKKHLHTIIYFKLSNFFNKPKFINSFSTLILFIFWFVPAVLCILFYDSLVSIVISIFLLFIIYLLIYKFLKIKL